MHPGARIAAWTMLFLAVAPPCTALGAGRGVYDRWDKLPGKITPVPETGSLPPCFWVPVQKEGSVVLFGLGAVRIAYPAEKGVLIREEQKEFAIAPGEIRHFTGQYASRKKGRLPLAVRKGAKGWEIAVPACLEVRFGSDRYSFIDADANGVFTEFGVDWMVKGDVAEWVKEREKREGEGPPEPGKGPEGERGGGGEGEKREAQVPLPFEKVKVPGELEVGKGRFLLAFSFPSTCLLCAVDDDVPAHVGPHNGYLNLLRAHGGLDPAGFSLKWYEGQVHHCRYMARNGLCHAEDQSKPEYTPEGTRAGQMSVCGSGEAAVDALRGMITTLYHSYDYLSPRIRTVCYAHEEKFYSCHIDADSPSDFVIYPFPGQDKVEPFGSSESPDPYPEKAQRPGGTFIRFLPPKGQQCTLQAMRITDLVTGKEVPALYSDPTCIPPSVSRYNYDYMLRTICLFPQTVLVSGHVYKVEVMIAFGKRKARPMGTVFRVK